MGDNAIDFSEIPALGDTAGLQNYLQNEQMAAQGVQPVPQEQQPAAQQAPNAAAQTNDTNAGNMSSNQVNDILAQLDAINKRLNNPQQAQPQPRQVAQPNPVQQPAQSSGYTPQEIKFVNEALARGYSLDQIQNTINKHRSSSTGFANPNNALEQRIAGLEQYLRTQEYKQAESEFINRISSFGEKFGLSEQDLVTFGNEALNHGINIANTNVDLETVFRAVYPEQYRIRMQRMTPTNTSQIYGGISIPEENRAQAGRIEDAYVDQFLRQAMPGQFQTLNNKK